MATWQKINTSSAEVNKLICTANSKSGYVQTINMTPPLYRWYWTIPSGYYGWGRNIRTNATSGGVNNNSQPENNNLPNNIAANHSFDHFFEKDMIITSNDKMKIHWHSSSTSAIFANTTKLFFAPVIIPPDTVDAKRFTSNNYGNIGVSDYEYLFSTGWDGTSDTKGIVKADMSSISGYSSNDTTYTFGFEWNFPSSYTIQKGSGLLFLITSDQESSGSNSKYLRNLSVVITGEEV